jgi:mannose-6-phosphate isomerase-like protein (cupin superfamily)
MLEKVDINALLLPHPPRTNFNIFQVDGSYNLRVARIAGQYPWHLHPTHDEAWVVLKGSVTIQTEAGQLLLKAGDAVRIPAGTRHSPTTSEADSTVLIVNSKEFQTKYLHGDSDETAGYTEINLDPGDS